VVQTQQTSPLALFAERRFRSFSEAADVLLETLADVLPGTVALARLETDERVHRVIDARGRDLAGLAPGVVLPQAGDAIDPDALRDLGAVSWLIAPLELSNGRIVGVLCAVDDGSAGHEPEHEALLATAGRMLSYEWESVELRSEVRRLRGRVNAGPGYDAETGLPDRASFLDQLGHEWRLTERGTVQSVLVACRVANGSDASSKLRRTLALKVAAEVLEGATRETDRVGRVDDETLGAVLVGCRPEDTPNFVARFLSALERVSGGDQPQVTVSCGVQPLAGTPTPHEALDMAEASASEAAQETRSPEATG
jgi:GGDEF domain-containing protein